MKWLGGNQALSFRIRSSLSHLVQHTYFTIGKMGPEKSNVTVLETDMECSPEIYDLSHGPQLFFCSA